MSDVVVIGGGVVGSSVAYRLAREGLAVTLVDRTDDGQATAAGAGIISPSVDDRRAEGIHNLSANAIAWYPNLLAQLAEDDEVATGYEVVGALLIATDDAEAERLVRAGRVAESRRAAGVQGYGEITQLDGQQAKELFPALDDVVAVIHLSGVARIDGRLMRDSLQRAAQRRGVTIMRGDARLRLDGSHAVVEVDGERPPAGQIVLAAGAWTAWLGREIGVNLPVYPQRGQIVHLDMPDADTSRWPVISTFQDHYLLTFPRNRVVVGATREDDSGFDYRMTAGGVAQVLTQALRVAPGLGRGALHEIRVGFRPASPDQLPLLGRAPGQADVYIATGHGPSGLTLGPRSGALVADLIRGEQVDLDLSPFDPGRFMKAG